MTRRVDDAMAADRPEKSTMRGLWVEEVQRLAGGDTDVPLYLTMPGARGGDIQALIDAGIIDLTETNAVADPEKTRLVAVENSPQAIVELQRHFPGLKILQEPIESLLHSDKLTAWPEGEHKKFFRARVVNFDLAVLSRGLHQTGPAVVSYPRPGAQARHLARRPGP